MKKTLKSVWSGCREALVPARLGKRQIIQNTLITLGILTVAALFCALFTALGNNDSAVPLVFVLAVLLIARLTDGYLFSMIATVVSVIGVNYVFTYPYFEFNFTIAGYPFMFLAMFTVSLVVGMLTDQIKRQGRIQAEVEKEKMKANLLRSVSHDLRTPLTSIIGSSSAILENYDALSDEAKRDLIGHVREEAQWLVRLVENILSITRINDGAVRIRKMPEAVEEIAAEAVAKFKKNRSSSLPVRVHVPPELMMVPMDSMLIEQVLINLMENVVLHAGSATQIELSIAEEDGFARFRVLDDGDGIEEARLPRLFDGLFSHANEMTGDGRKNLGIGLSACMSIVRAHGGDMSAQNRPEGGACISFTLPMEEENHGC